MTYEELSMKHRPPPLDLRLAFGCVCGWRTGPGVKAWMGTLGFSEGQHTAVFVFVLLLAFLNNLHRALIGVVIVAALIVLKLNANA